MSRDTGTFQRTSTIKARDLKSNMVIILLYDLFIFFCVISCCDAAPSEGGDALLKFLNKFLWHSDSV